MRNTATPDRYACTNGPVYSELSPAQNRPIGQYDLMSIVVNLKLVDERMFDDFASKDAKVILGQRGGQHHSPAECQENGSHVPDQVFFGEWAQHKYD